MKEKVSIVIPVYNVEKYIEQCICSIQMQTYSNLEIILIDDESRDSSSEICDKYASLDSRIHVIHKKNEGASLARAAGLSLATGSYVMFVDADDWIDLDTVEVCLETALRNNADCVLFSYIKEYSNKSIENPLFPDGFFYEGDKSGEKVHERIIGLQDSELTYPERIDNLSSMCMKLYRTEIARQGKFVSERVVGTSEDTLFNVYALEKCKNINYVNKCFYHYRKTNQNSIITQYKTNLPEKWDQLYQYFEEYIYASNKVSQYYKLLLNRVACGMIGLGINEINSKESIFKKVLNIKKILLRPLYIEAFKQLNIKKCPLKWKIFFLLCKFRCSSLLTLLLILINKLRLKK